MKREKNNVLPLWMKAGLAATLLVLVVAGAWFFKAQQAQHERHVEDQMWSIARLKAGQIADWRAERLADAAVLATRQHLIEDVKRFLAAPSADVAEAIKRRLQPLKERFHFADILLVGPEHRVRWSLSGRLENCRGYASSLAAATATGGPVWTKFHAESEYPFPHFSVIVPLFARAKGDTPIGFVILISDATQFLYPLIRSWPIPSETGETLLIRREGDDVLFLNELRHQKDTALKLKIPRNRVDLPAAMALAGQTGIVRGKDYRGVDVVAAILPVPDSLWYMVAKVDAAEAFAEWRFSSLIISGLILLLLGFLVTTGLVVRQRNLKAHYLALYHSEADLRKAMERYGVTLQAIGDGVITTDAMGRVELVNPVAEGLTGWTQGEARGKALREVFRIINEETRNPVEDPVTRVLQEGAVVGLANHTVLIARDGKEIPIADSGAPIRDGKGEMTGVVLVFRDQSEERLARQLTETRFSLIEHAAGHTLDEFLTRAIDVAGDFVASPIGFYHLVMEDQKTLSLQQWSTQTLKKFCKVKGKGMHYDIEQAGVWVDCVRERKPVIHNDYASLPHRKGLPDGHAEVIRELVVPVMREGKIVAILGVGNKPADYTEKDVNIVSYLADVTWEIVRHKQADEDLCRVATEWQTTFNAAREAIWILGPDHRILRANKQAEQLFGCTLGGLIGKRCWEIVHGTDEPISGCPVIQARKSLRRETLELAMGDRWIQVTVDPILDDVDGFAGAVHIIADTTERKRAEHERGKLQNQLLQAQKMESVGRLAGGVAHDFNNMLSVILGCTQLAMDNLEPTDPIYENLQEVLNAGSRSVDIVRQLLAFARKQTIDPKVLDLNETVEGMLKMLGRLIGEDIDLAWEPGSDLWPVLMDPSQLDQILANLCINARDAIPGTGKITIGTENTVLDEAYCRIHAGFKPGQFVVLAVSDDGCGMDRETLNKVFEPFFTTKEMGKGTGLGLSTAYGIVKQNEGFVNVYSKPDKGTTFRIYLTRHEGEAESKTKADGSLDTKARGETILLVEDDASVLRLSTQILEGLGYRVLWSQNPLQALYILRQHGDQIHLLITDVVMPEMSGKDLAEAVTKMRPGIRTLFMSGYTANTVVHHGIQEKGVNFIEKPLTPQRLARKVREVLETQNAES